MATTKRRPVKQTYKGKVPRGVRPTMAGFKPGALLKCGGKKK